MGRSILSTLLIGSALVYLIRRYRRRQQPMFAFRRGSRRWMDELRNSDAVQMITHLFGRTLTRRWAR